LAQLFHETYERLAPSFGYETRKESAVPWDDVPEQNRALMVVVVGEVLDALLSELEQAERALNDTRWTLEAEAIALRGAEARLAKVQADLEHCSVGWATDTAKLRDANERLAKVPALIEDIQGDLYLYGIGELEAVHALNAIGKTLADWEQE
jgi:hypothetical protein